MILIYSLCLVLSSIFMVESKEVICYAPTWDLDALNKVDTSLCTQILISFAKPHANGTITYPNLTPFSRLWPSKVLLAIGGADWESTTNFAIIAAEFRSEFAQNCLEILEKHDFLNGIDIDWEYPREDTEDYDNFVLLMKELRAKLGKKYLLTTAVGSGTWRISVSYNLKELDKYVDYFNLMTYDFHSDSEWDIDWDNPDNPHYGVYFNAPINGPGETGVTGIQNYLKQNISSLKLNVGIPFYGRMYSLIDSTKTAPRSPCIIGNQENNRDIFMPNYNSFCSKMKNNTWIKEWDKVTLAPYMYHETSWISFENQESVIEKAKLVNQFNLAGVMIWALNQDDYNGDCSKCKFSLLRAVNSAIGRSATCIELTEGGKRIPICTEIRNISHPDDCQWYYDCEQIGYPPKNIEKCSSGKYWNDLTQECGNDCVA
uniref:CSON005432 protein n=1 Tax=Culicoides sonorensis TaxID=179676 RepID=A0A336L9H5_CULSO